MIPCVSMCFTFSVHHLLLSFFCTFFFTQFLTVFAAACESSVVFDVEMESVIAVTSVLCNIGAPPPPGLSGGAARVTNP